VTAETDATTHVDAPEPDEPAAGGTVVTSAGGVPVRTVRRAKVAVTRIDPWSVMKISFALFVALAIVLVIAVAVLWWVLDSSGVFDQVSQSILTITGTDNGSGNLTDNSFQLKDYISLSRVLGVTTVLAVINTILLTALATLAAFLFNLSTGLVGGVDVTLTETD
jgi:ABC-type glycerol-3-phosphate transport system permease component